LKKGCADVTKSDDRRSAILDLLADHVLMHGLSESSLRPLAKAAHTSDRMLYYFKDKADIIAAVLARVFDRLVVLMNAQTANSRLPLAQLRRQLTNIMLTETLWPYMRLWLEIASLAAYGDPVCRAVGEQIARGFLAWGVLQLDSATPEADSAALLVTIEGIVLLKSVGLDDVSALAL
jgi:AcrR family transcriptional regulator